MRHSGRTIRRFPALYAAIASGNAVAQERRIAAPETAAGGVTGMITPPTGLSWLYRGLTYAAALHEIDDRQEHDGTDDGNDQSCK